MENVWVDFHQQLKLTPPPGRLRVASTFPGSLFVEPEMNNESGNASGRVPPFPYADKATIFNFSAENGGFVGVGEGGVQEC